MTYGGVHVFYFLVDLLSNVLSIVESEVLMSPAIIVDSLYFPCLVLSLQLCSIPRSGLVPLHPFTLLLELLVF